MFGSPFNNCEWLLANVATGYKQMQTRTCYLQVLTCSAVRHGEDEVT